MHLLKSAFLSDNFSASASYYISSKVPGLLALGADLRVLAALAFCRESVTRAPQAPVSLRAGASGAILTIMAARFLNILKIF